VRLHAADVELRRVSGLATNHVASAAELDRATADANSLRARLDQQRAEIAVAERQLALWQQQLEIAVYTAPNAVTKIVQDQNLKLVPEAALPPAAGDWVGNTQQNPTVARR